MRFGEHFLEELKARIRFFVNDEKGFYHCFSSGKHGDAISFLMEVEGLSFPEAVEALATMAGMEMPKADPQAEARAARNKETVIAQTARRRGIISKGGASARQPPKRLGWVLRRIISRR